jgi:flagellar assembly protein FliH
VTIAPHPDDHAVLVEDGVEELLAAFPGRSIRVVGDPTLRPGDAVATSGASTIDARLGAGLDRARRLLADPSGSGEPAQR